MCQHSYIVTVVVWLPSQTSVKVIIYTYIYIYIMPEPWQLLSVCHSRNVKNWYLFFEEDIMHVCSHKLIAFCPSMSSAWREILCRLRYPWKHLCILISLWNKLGVKKSIHRGPDYWKYITCFSQRYQALMNCYVIKRRQGFIAITLCMRLCVCVCLSVC